ncbi:hypothetical protein NST17_20095 [Caldifermentibacillus hisashii]|uniref:Uncharacterized protein n=1 Tax=Caldifermentibacillus hisashii TaxID=996558 RepID=A0ABU9K305_9BACI
MKQITLQIQDINEQVIDEKTVTISDQDKLIFKPNKNVSITSLRKTFEGMQKALTTDSNLLYIPEWLNLEILKVK